MTYGHMLANTGPATPEAARHLASQGYTFDMKWDGVRGIAVVDTNGVQLLNLKGEDFAYRYPEIVTALMAIAKDKGPMVLDGEIVIFDPATGEPRFHLTGQRALGRGRMQDIAMMARRMPATFVAFDVLAIGDLDLRETTQDGRFAVLDSLIPGSLQPGMNSTVRRSIRSDDGVLMLDMVHKNRLEGIIAKRLAGTYRAGRRSDWIKMKVEHTASVVVTGWEVGEGKRASTFGALQIAAHDNTGTLVNLGKVGSGFSDAELATLEPFVKAGQQIVGEVRYMQRQPGTGVLRQPVWLGVRWDMDPADCKIADV